MRSFYKDLAEQVPEARPGDLARAIGEYRQPQEQLPTPVPVRRNWRDSHSSLTREQRIKRVKSLGGRS